MRKWWKAITEYTFKKRRIQDDVARIGDNFRDDNSSTKELRPYKCIPVYSENDMEQAVVDNSDETKNEYIGRQALNGYASLYNEEWVVGKNRMGQIVKTNEMLLFEMFESDKEERNQRILYTQNHALYGTDLYDEVFCKFTYDIVDQNKYSIHTELKCEYKENEVIEDCGHYGGLHFVPLEHIELCLEHRNTLYGNKMVLLKPIKDEVYYEYMENVFVGKKVFVLRVMSLRDVETWREIVTMTECIKKNKTDIIAYLKELEKKDNISYEESMKYISEL